MTKASEISPFRKRLYDKFEDHAHKVLGVSGDSVRGSSGEHGHDVDADFEAAYEFARAASKRQNELYFVFLGASLLLDKNWSATNRR